MPTLMKGLNECCKIRPDDPVDFLVRLLLLLYIRKNPSENINGSKTVNIST